MNKSEPIKSSQYDSWHTRRAVANEDAALQPWHQTVLKLLPDLNGLSVLEIGCGTGSFSLSLAEKYPSAKITAVDFSPAAIAVANQRQSTKGIIVQFVVENAEQLSFADRRFDYIVSCECLEHVPKPDKMCREMARVLKPGGGWILTTENYLNGMLLLWVNCYLRNRPFDSGSGVQPHENFFLFWRVRRMLRRGGLRVLHMESNHFQWLLLPRFAPHRLCTNDFRNPIFKRIFRPFGPHFTFQGTKD